MRSLTTLLPVILLFSACTDEKLDEASNGPTCEGTSTVLALDEVSALGFSGADLVALAAGLHEDQLYWYGDESTTDLSLTVTHADGEVRYVDLEAVYPEGETTAIGIECDDYVEVDITLDLVTADGAFAETWSTTLAGLDAAAAWISLDFDQDTLTGSYTYTDMDPSEYDSLSHSVRVDFEAESCSGEISVQVEGSDPDCEGDECTAWASMDTVASWPASDME